MSDKGESGFRLPEQLMGPKFPTPAERAEHDKDHLPFWCWPHDGDKLANLVIKGRGSRTLAVMVVPRKPTGEYAAKRIFAFMKERRVKAMPGKCTIGTSSWVRRPGPWPGNPSGSAATRRCSVACCGT